jgi:hypothetical protein
MLNRLFPAGMTVKGLSWRAESISSGRVQSAVSILAAASDFDVSDLLLSPN